jgi:uncharacterized surface protein with fasciclin (FAS1) repeats
VKRSIRNAGLGLVAAAFLFTAVACGNDDDDATTTTTSTTAETTTSTTADEATGNIVEVAVGAGDFTVLAELLTAAGLVDTLSGEGPFTVFAPTDQAFEDAAAELGVTLEELAAALTADTALLTEILTYHVVASEVPASVVLTLDGQAVETVAGVTFTVNVDGETVTITDAEGRVANVVNVDVAASNGIIHILDKVLLPAIPALG